MTWTLDDTRPSQGDAYIARLNIAVCPRQITAAHEQQDWYDVHGPKDTSIDGMGVGPSIFWRDTSTTRNQAPDGWVLNIGNGDEWLIGPCVGDEDSALEQALSEARAYLRDYYVDHPGAREKFICTPEQWAAVRWLFDAAQELQREQDEREGRKASE